MIRINTKYRLISGVRYASAAAVKPRGTIRILVTDKIQMS